MFVSQVRNPFSFFLEAASASSSFPDFCLLLSSQAPLAFLSRLFTVSSLFRSLNYSFEFSGLHCCLFVKVLFCQAILGDYQRRRRDLNPRAAINDLLPFQGSPFSLLGTSPNQADLFLLMNQTVNQSAEKVSPAERVGFEPTRPCGQTVFKTASL